MALSDEELRTLSGDELEEVIRALQLEEDEHKHYMRRVNAIYTEVRRREVTARATRIAEEKQAAQ